MDVAVAQQDDERVATDVSPDAGTEVFCENGCGNRVLERDERIPFPCPTGCGGVMTAEMPAAKEQRTKSVTLPTLGRIVHLHVAAGVWRPAIVMGAEPDGLLLVHAFLHESDPQGRLREGVGHTTYGTGLGQWVWPTKEDKIEFLAELPLVESD
jgi:hypothetical protein